MFCLQLEGINLHGLGSPTEEKQYDRETYLLVDRNGENVVDNLILS